MNIGQVLDGAVGKTVMFSDMKIRENPESVKNVISWLNDNIIKHLYNDTKYYENVKNNIIGRLDDQEFRNEFVESILNSNLYIEAPCFSHIDLDKLNKNWISPNESVLIKKETIEFIRDRLKLRSDFVITSDIVRDNIFCSPMYVNKLYKLTKSIINSRDFGLVKDITQQPVRGRAHGGGSRLGQMEIEGLLTAGCDLSVKEFLTVKSDHNEEKRKFVKQVVEKGDFDMSDGSESIGRTKKVVSTILNFLKE
jgi:DNA-directed RNA polymerase beta subunit